METPRTEACWELGFGCGGYEQIVELENMLWMFLLISVPVMLHVLLFKIKIKFPLFLCGYIRIIFIFIFITSGFLGVIFEGIVHFLKYVFWITWSITPAFDAWITKAYLAESR